MFQIVCIGSSSKDIFFPTKDGQVLNTPEDITAQKKMVFELGAKYHIDNRFESLGGCAVNVACGLRRLGVSSTCYAALGRDNIGQWIESELKKENVGVDFMQKEDCLTGLSAIVVDENSGERIIFSNQESNERLKINPEEIKNFAWISVTDLSGNWQDALKIIENVFSENAVKISYNPRGRNITEDAQSVYDFAKKTEIFFVNKDEAIELVTLVNTEVKDNEKINDEIFLLDELKKAGAKVVVITDGTRGAWVSDGIDIFHAEVLEVEAVDSTGAGDAFSSGFLAGYISDKNIEECLKMGIANGANVVSYYGAIEGLLHDHNISQFSEKIKVKKIN